MEKFTWKCVKALFFNYFFLVYTILHSQSTDRIRIRWKIFRLRIRPKRSGSGTLSVCFGIHLHSISGFNCIFANSNFACSEQIDTDPDTELRYVTLIRVRISQIWIRVFTCFREVVELVKKQEFFLSWEKWRPSCFLIIWLNTVPMYRTVQRYCDDSVVSCAADLDPQHCVRVTIISS